MPRGRLYLGTSGYAYPEWKGAFYPPDLPAGRFLPFYAERFSTVEINNTFYRFPSETTLRSWHEQTPPEFRFAVKANRRVTHDARLRDAAVAAALDFIARCRALGPKLGPVLFQLPPYLRRDDERLAAFLAALPRDARYAFEFRHPSWFDAHVLELLARHDTALCVNESEGLGAPPVATTDFAYLRLRKEAYTDREVEGWRRWIERELEAGRDVYAYLKHDEEGAAPELALRLLGPTA
jgi:uncharacterized protein YecE (DUF72 family)